MTRIRQLSILLPALLLALLVGGAKAASGNGVHDDAKFFSDNAISQATAVIDQIDRKHQKDLLVETIPSVSDDQQTQLQSEGKEAFFHNLVMSHGNQMGVRGVFILICKDPPYVFVDPGKSVRSRLFTLDDAAALRAKLVAAFKAKEFDQGLIDGADFVLQKMDAHATASTGTGMVPPASPGNRMPAVPGANGNWGIGGLACAVIAIVFGIIALRGIFGRSRGGYYPQQGGGYYPPQGGYPQQGGGYYPPNYGGGGGGGSGFGRGFLGGLLGGAVGGYAADRFLHPGQQSSGGFTPSGGDAGAGGGFGDTSSGPDFGGAGDVGSGGDFGGGGGGGDFSGGGGGDSGGSSGGDF